MSCAKQGWKRHWRTLTELRMNFYNRHIDIHVVHKYKIFIKENASENVLCKTRVKATMKDLDWTETEFL